MKNYFDIYIVGVGGQGVLTIADIITLTATRENVDINYYPTKAWHSVADSSKRSCVSAERRIPLAPASAREAPIWWFPWNCAKPPCHPLRQARCRICGAGRKVVAHGCHAGTRRISGKGDCVQRDSEGRRFLQLHSFGGRAFLCTPELFVLGVIFANTALRNLFSVADIEETIANRWPKVAESNLKTFRAGLAYAAEKA